MYEEGGDQKRAACCHESGGEQRSGSTFGKVMCDLKPAPPRDAQAVKEKDRGGTRPALRVDEGAEQQGGERRESEGDNKMKKESIHRRSGCHARPVGAMRGKDNAGRASNRGAVRRSIL